MSIKKTNSAGSGPSEKDLGAALRRGDHEAFKKLFERYYPSLLAYLTTLTNDQAVAKDLSQQTFFNLWEKREYLSESRSPKQYLFSMGHNLFVDHFRHLQIRYAAYGALKHEALTDHLEEDNEYLEQRIQRLKKVIALLPPSCQEILRLNKLEGLKYTEIAEYLNISVKTVESQMRRAYKKIREYFDQDDPIVLFFLPDILKNIYKEKTGGRSYTKFLRKRSTLKR